MLALIAQLPGLAAAVQVTTASPAIALRSATPLPAAVDATIDGMSIAASSTIMGVDTEPARDGELGRPRRSRQNVVARIASLKICRSLTPNMISQSLHPSMLVQLSEAVGGSSDAKLRLASYMLRMVDGVSGGIAGPTLQTGVLAVSGLRMFTFAPLHMLRHGRTLQSSIDGYAFAASGEGGGQCDMLQLQALQSAAMLAYYPLAAASVAARVSGSTLVSWTALWRPACMLWMLWIGAYAGHTFALSAQSGDARIVCGRLAKVSLDVPLAVNFAFPGAAGPLPQLLVGILGTLSSSVTLWLAHANTGLDRLGSPPSRSPFRTGAPACIRK